MRPILAEPDGAGGRAVTRRLRLLHVTPTYYPAVRYGGPIVSVHGLCKSLAARGHEVHVFTTNVDGEGNTPVPLEAATELEGVKVRYFSAGLGRRLFRAPAMARALEREIGDFDLLHLHSVYLWPTTVAARIARSRGTPYVLSPRGMLVPELIEAKSAWLKRAWISLFERANIAGAASVHVTSQAEAAQLRRLALHPRRLDIAPNGVEMPDLPEGASTNKQGRRVLYLGRLSWKKRLDCLIRALVSAPQVDLTIAGFDDEGLAQSLEALARELGLQHRVRVLGPRLGADKWALMRACDVFVLPSRQENFGVAALEALACGLPVVAAPGVGLAPAIAAAGAGVVVESEPAALGAALARLIDDPDARARMGAAGRTLAREKYGWSGVAAVMETLYGELLNAAEHPLPPCGGGPGWGVGASAALSGGPRPSPSPPQQGGRGRQAADPICLQALDCLLTSGLTNMTSSITPVILTYNEAANIARTLEGVAWAEDIVVVDSFSADSTPAIAAAHPNVRVFQRRFDSHAEQWNFAILQTGIRSEWILALDADYVAPPAMRDELARAASDGRRSGFSARFRYCLFGRPLRASLYPPHVVMFRRGRGRFEQCGHTQRLRLDGEIGRLSVKFDHDDRKPLGRWIEAQMRYARLEAEFVATRRGEDLRMLDRLRRTGWLAPFAVLFHTLVFKGLLFEGWRGWFYVLQRVLFEILFCLAWLERGPRLAPTTAAPSHANR